MGMRRLVPSTWKGRIAVAIPVVLALLVSIGVPAGLSAVADLRFARARLDEAKDAARRVDVPAARAALDEADAALERAIDRLGSPALAVARATPVVADSVQAVRDLADASRLAIQGARHGIDVAADLNSANGVEGLAGLDWSGFEQPLTQAAELLRRAAELASRAEDAWMPGASTTRDEAIAELASLATGARDAITATRMMSALLDGSTRHIMVVVQNSADLRATGGFPDQFVVLSAGPQGVGVVGSYSDDPLPASYPHDFVDWHAINRTPDFASAGWKFARVGSVVSGKRIDLVLALDSRAIATLLSAVGSVTLDGVTVTGDDYLEFSTLDIYRRYPDSRERQRFEDAFVAVFIGKLFSPSSPLTGLLPQIGPLTARRHVQAWSRIEAVQDALEDLGVAGRVSSEVAVNVGVFGNQQTRTNWSKVWPWVSHEIDYTLTVRNGVATASMTLTIRNDAPVDRLPERALGPADGHAIADLVVYGLDAAKSRIVAIDVPPGESVTERLEGTFPCCGDSVSGIALLRAARVGNETFRVRIDLGDERQLDDGSRSIELTDPEDGMLGITSAAYGS